MTIEMNEDMGIFRPGWTSTGLTAFNDARYRGVTYKDYFVATKGEPGRLLRVEAMRRDVQAVGNR